MEDLYSYDYRLLKKRIKQYRYTVSGLANAINVDRSTLSRKLNGSSEFSQKDIIKLTKVLNLSPYQVYKYFFTQKVEKTLQK